MTANGEQPLLRPHLDLPFDQDHRFGAELGSRGHHFGRRPARVEGELQEPVAVAEVDEDEPPQVAHAVDPATEADEDALGDAGRLLVAVGRNEGQQVPPEAGAVSGDPEKFGLEPVGRARISVPKQKEPESKWAGVLA